ncbi:MAG: hypothetical protein REI11_20690 [Patulibacter sp.]|nr:hypothetical protein [Patulibacter sp.]
MSRFRAIAALLLTTAFTAVALPQTASADPVPTGAAAVAAVNAVLAPHAASEQVVSAVFSPDGTRVAYRQQTGKPGGGTADPKGIGQDLWVMRADGTSRSRISDVASWSGQSSAPVSLVDPSWAPDSSGLAYATVGPGHPSTVVTRTFTATATGDDWSGEQDYHGTGVPQGFAYTADSHWLVYTLVGSGSGVDSVYAVDRDSATPYTAQTIRSGSVTWAPECATVTEGSWTAPVHSGNAVVDALTGDTPACKFGVTPDPVDTSVGSGSHAGADTSTATVAVTKPVFDDSPGVTAANRGAFTPISERVPSTIIPGPELKITAVGTGLASARKSGLHVKYTLDRIAKLKVWIILPGTGARYGDEAFAGVPAKTIARTSTTSGKAGAGSLRIKFDADGKDALDSASRVAVQVKITATDVAGRSTTVVKSVTLRR